MIEARRAAVPCHAAAVDERIAANRANWDDRTAIHVGSAFYDVEGWLADPPGPRAREVDALGDVAGLDLVHLQCHFGLDTLTFAVAGATVTGLDVSGAAVAEARAIAARAGLDDRARFVEGDVLDAAAVLRDAGFELPAFDVVYVSLGALCWLPSVERWARQVGELLRPGGRLYLHDGHPLQWAMADDDTVVEHTYYEEAEPFVSDEAETYTDLGSDQTGADLPGSDLAGTAPAITNTVTYEWNHSIGEIVNAVIGAGLRIDRLDEHDWTVYRRFDWLEETEPHVWSLPADRPRFPLTFTLLATRTGTALP